jgi:serine/threonine-protein kinase
MLGSPRYMAPEQVRNSKDVDSRADLWSVGVVLFQLITGEHAFLAKTNVEASIAVLTSEPQKLCALSPKAPAGLEDVVRRCLTRDVGARFQTAKELATALRPFGSV